MYKGMRNDQNQMVSRTLSELSAKGKLVQTGFYEKSILCADCDNRILGRLDDYADGLLYGKGLIIREDGFSPDGQIRMLNLQGIDYKKFKLFLLSVLWRAHISKNKFFENVNLGTEADKIRKIILNDVDVDESTYKIVMFAIMLNERELARMVVTPRHINENGLNFCTFIINGFVYQINLQQKDSLPIFSKEILRHTGQLNIAILNPEQTQMVMSGYLKITNPAKWIDI